MLARIRAHVAQVPPVQRARLAVFAVLEALVITAGTVMHPRSHITGAVLGGIVVCGAILALPEDSLSNLRAVLRWRDLIRLAALAGAAVALAALFAGCAVPASGTDRAPRPVASPGAGHTMTPAAACAYLHATGSPGRITVPTQAELAYAAAHIAPTATGLAERALIAGLHDAQAHRHPDRAAADLTFLTLTCNLVSKGYQVGPAATHAPGPAA